MGHLPQTTGLYSCKLFCHCFKYRSATHPDLKIFDSTSVNRNLSGRLTASNSRLPSPATTGVMTNRYSSTRQARSVEKEYLRRLPKYPFLVLVSVSVFHREGSHEEF